MDQDMKLTPEEEQFLRTVFADPKRKYQFLTVVSRQIKDFDAWYADEKDKESKDKLDKDNMSLLRQVIANFNT